MKEILVWLLENLTNIIALVSVVIAIISVIISKLKIKKTRKECEVSNDLKDLKEAIDELDDTKSQLKDSEDMLAIIREIIPTAIKTAEKCGLQVSGPAKKLLAISDVIQRCATNGIDYNAFAADIDRILEDQIEFSKEVNAK